MSTAEHWDQIYADRPTEELGWYEPAPSTLALVTEHCAPEDPVIDVGAGTSGLTQALLALGYEDLTVLELSQVALDRARSRLGSRAELVRWIHADVTAFEPDRTWQLWHDRAVFHFLVDQEQRDAYRSTAHRALAPGGVLVVATFGADAPDHCAGLPVSRYDPDSLAAAFAPEFEVVSVETVGPASAVLGDQRAYIAGVFSH